MKVKDITNLLEKLAPPALQETYDNAGLIVGDPGMEVSGVLVSLDAIEPIIDEAIERKCNMVVSHHPIVFKGLKRLNGSNYVERVVMKAVKNNIALYAIHTNLDNVLQNGVNAKIAEKLGLKESRILAPKSGQLLKLVCYTPNDYSGQVLNALFGAGAGHIGKYSECSFSSTGEGSFTAGEGSNPFVGKLGERHYEREQRLEVVLPRHAKSAVIKALMDAHPYEEVAYDVYAIENSSPTIGSGMIGQLPEPMPKKDFLAMLKQQMKTAVVRYTETDKTHIQTVALCGGSGSFLIHNAKVSGADAYVTGDVKYHEFFDGEDSLMICDIGHYESEQFTIELLHDYLTENLPNFAVVFTQTNTNPIQYL